MNTLNGLIIQKKRACYDFAVSRASIAVNRAGSRAGGQFVIRRVIDESYRMPESLKYTYHDD